MAAKRLVCYVVYGEAAARAAERSIDSLRYRNPTLPTMTVGDRPVINCIRRSLDPATYLANDVDRSRWAKLNLPWHLGGQPLPDTLYLDADTRPLVDVSPGFGLLEDGWDVVLTRSDNQGADWLWHSTEDDRAATIDACGYKPVQGQCGMFFVRWNARTVALWLEWRRAWWRLKGQDQGAFLQALHKAPVRLWLWGRPWNGGTLIQHRFGEARA